MQQRKYHSRKRGSSGALLLELLIVIALLGIILSVAANGMFLSMRSNKISGERDTANFLAIEALEAVRATAGADWQNIYALTKSTQHYKTTQSSGVWVLSSGDETITLSNTAYTRYVTIDNVSRDNSTRNIQTTYSISDDDPSTQKVTVVVTWPNGNPITISEYFFRWRNKVCAQSSWVTGGSGDNVQLCSDTTYDTKDASLDVSTGSLQLLP